MDQPESKNSAPPDHPSPPARDSAKRHRKYWVWIALFLIAALLFWIFSRHGQNAQPAATTTGGRRALGGPVSITTVTAKKGDIAIYLEAIGTVTAFYTNSITAQVTGVITAVHY